MKMGYWLLGRSGLRVFRAVSRCHDIWHPRWGTTEAVALPGGPNANLGGTPRTSFMRSRESSLRCAATRIPA
jgi:hypothetical protein